MKQKVTLAVEERTGRRRRRGTEAGEWWWVDIVVSFGYGLDVRDSEGLGSAVEEAVYNWGIRM